MSNRREAKKMRAWLKPKQARRIWRLCARWAIAALLVLRPGFANSADDQVKFTSEDVEAAYLYNFGKFVQWPPSANGSAQPFSLCLLGQDDFGKKLDDLISGETIQGRKIVAERLSSLKGVERCQIVFIGNSEEARVAKELEVLRTKPVLTVSSLNDFLGHGGMIQFLLEGNRVRFAVDLPAAHRAGLTLSSELLKVAVHVNTEPAEEGK